MSLQQQLDSFRQFVADLLKTNDQQPTIDEAFDRWRLENRTPEEAEEDVAAVQASLDDFHNGDRGVPVEESIAEQRRKFGLSE